MLNKPKISFRKKLKWTLEELVGTFRKTLVYLHLHKKNIDLPSIEFVIIIVRIGLPRILQLAPKNPTRDLILSARNSLSSAK